MKLPLPVLILSTCCSLLASCAQTPNVITRNVLQDNPEWFVCDRVLPADRPALPPGHVIDWSAVATVAQAKAEHDAYVVAQIARNEVVSGYIVRVEEDNFVCWNNMETQREFYESLPRR